VAKTEATFGINLEGNVSDVAKGNAASLDDLRESISKGQNAIRDMGASMRLLRGKSEEVVNVKKELKAKIEAERQAITKNQLALIKQGTSYDALAKAAKKPKADSITKLSDAISGVGGPAKGAISSLEGFASVLGEGGSLAGAAGLAIGGLAVAAVALAGSLAFAISSLAKFVVTTGNALRNQQLLRAAWAGSEQNATALGQQIELLGTKVSTSRDALNTMGVGLLKAGVQGQVLVDTLEAVARASDALGEDAGNKLKEFVERGRMSQRFVVNPLELQGSGLNFDEIAGELAASLKIGIADARAALAEGRVSLAAGADAMKKAVEKKFASINARKLLSIEGLTARLKKSLEAMTSGVNLDPLAKSVDGLLSVFEPTTVTGYALREMLTGLGNAASGSLGGAIPIVKAFMQGLIIGALQVDIAILKLRKSFQDTFGKPEWLAGIDATRTALVAGKVVITSLAVGVATLAAGLAVLGGAAYLAVKPLITLWESFQKAKDAITAIDWASLGDAVVRGIVDGIKRTGSTLLVDTVKGLAASVRDTFKAKLEIKSPSRVMQREGRQIPAGAALGVEDGTADVQAAVGAMVPTSLSAPRGGVGGASGGSVTLNLTINVAGGSNAGEVKQALSSPALLAPMLRALEEMLLGAGLTPGGSLG
jgi:hypothetical protein